MMGQGYIWEALQVQGRPAGTRVWARVWANIRLLLGLQVGWGAGAGLVQGAGSAQGLHCHVVLFHTSSHVVLAILQAIRIRIRVRTTIKGSGQGHPAAGGDRQQQQRTAVSHGPGYTGHAWRDSTAEATRVAGGGGSEEAAIAAEQDPHKAIYDHL